MHESYFDMSLAQTEKKNLSGGHTECLKFLFKQNR